MAAGSALAGLSIPHVHAGEDNTIRLALIGCGGRGSGATVNAFESPAGPVKLVAMADLFEKRLESAHKVLSRQFADKVDVPPDRRFLGFDAYRKAIDCLRPGDVAMLTGYAGFRPHQMEYAVEKGINVFMEKSFAPDPPGVRRVIKAAEAAEKKNLKIAAGLMCRHSRNRQELIKRIRDGQLGQIQLIRAYRMGGSGALGRKPAGEKELFWQIRNFTKFLWVAGGLFAEMDIHQIDELCWIKDAWPVSAHGVGGRAANNVDCSQNLDSFSIEWTFPDGTKAYDVVRYIPRCYEEFNTLSTALAAPAVLRQYPCRDVSHLQGPALHSGQGDRQVRSRFLAIQVLARAAQRRRQHRLAGSAGEDHALAGRVGRALGCNPPRSAARGQAGRAVEPGRHHGPGRRAFRQGHHLGRGDGLELPVLPGHRPHDRGQPAADPARRRRALSGADPRHLVGDLNNDAVPPFTGDCPDLRGEVREMGLSPWAAAGWFGPRTLTSLPLPAAGVWRP